MRVNISKNVRDTSRNRAQSASNVSSSGCLSTKSRWVIVFALLGGILLLGTTAWAARPLYEAAATLWKSSLDQYKAGHWDQAQPLLEEFARKYDGNENAPRALTYAAICALKQDKQKDFERLVDFCIQKYPNTPEWLACFGAKLHEYREQDQPEEYMKNFFRMISITKVLYTDVSFFQKRFWGHGNYDPEFQVEFEGQTDISILPETNSWQEDILWAAQDPDRAKKMLSVLTQTFQGQDNRLTPSLQYLHYRLLVLSGDTDKAAETMQEYLETWDNDPRQATLKLFVLWDWKIHGVSYPDAEQFWDTLLSRYAKIPSLSPFFGSLMTELMDKDHEDPEALVEVTRAYFQAHDPSAWNIDGAREDRWEDLAQYAKRKAKNSPEVSDSILALMEEIPSDSVGDRVKRLWLKMGILEKLDRGDALGKTAAELLNEENYSGKNYYQLLGHGRGRRTNYVEKFPAVAKTVAEAETKWNIAAVDKNSDAGKLYQDFQKRMKDDRIRIAEELAEELSRKHRNDPATAEALYELTGYFFQNLMPEQRDKWAETMVKLFPRHPRTEEVIQNQITAAKAAKQPDSALPWLKQLGEHFPGARDEKWLDTFTWAYKTKESSKDVLAVTNVYYGKAADAGSLVARQHILKARFEARGFERDDKVGKAGFWQSLAAEVKGTFLEAWCYEQAFQAGYSGPNRDTSEYGVCSAAVDGLMQQNANPFAQWTYRFAKVNVACYVNQPLPAKTELDAILSSLPESIPDLSDRLDMPALGSALGKAQMLQDGEAYIKQFQTKTFTHKDQWSLTLMKAAMHAANDDPATSARLKLDVVYKLGSPARGFDLFNSAFRDMGRADGSINWHAETYRYFNLVRTNPNVAAPVLGMLAERYMRMEHPGWKKVQADLLKYYPASFAMRDLAERYKKMNAPEEQEE